MFATRLVTFGNEIAGAAHQQSQPSESITEFRLGLILT
jgi:hypothetical protein